MIFEGYSPTVLLDGGPSCQAFTKMSLKGIVAKVSQGAPQNLLGLKLKPLHSQKLEYTVQYNETAFAFIDRLARRFGEWCYYDGLELVLGQKKQPETKLFYGYNLLHLDFALQTSPVHGKFLAYGYKGSENGKAATKKSDTSISGTAAFSLQQAEKTWQPAEPRFVHQFAEEEALQGQIDALAKLSLQAAAARQVQISGGSSNPALFPGAIVEIKSAGAGREYGRYTSDRPWPGYNNTLELQKKEEREPNIITHEPLLDKIKRFAS